MSATFQILDEIRRIAIGITCIRKRRMQSERLFYRGINEERIRTDGAQWLMIHGRKRDLKALAEAFSFNSQYPETRKAIIYAIKEIYERDMKQMENKRAGYYFRWLLKTDPIQLLIDAVLGAWKRGMSNEWVKIPKDESPEVRCTALYVLGELCNPVWICVFAKALEDGNGKVEERAAEALAKTLVKTLEEHPEKASSLSREDIGKMYALLGETSVHVQALKDLNIHGNTEQVEMRVSRRALPEQVGAQAHRIGKIQ